MILFLFLTLGCGNHSEKKEQTEIEIENKELPAEERAEQALYKELMAVHDKSMPKMDYMMQLKGDLREQLDELREKEEIDSVRMQKLENTINHLEAASEGMMQWMRNFEPLNTGDKTHEEIMAYYEDKKKSIEKVSKDMDQAIEEAEKLREE